MTGDVAMRTILTSQEDDQFPEAVTGAWSIFRGEERAVGVDAAGAASSPGLAGVMVHPSTAALPDVGVVGT